MRVVLFGLFIILAFFRSLDMCWADSDKIDLGDILVTNRRFQINSVDSTENVLIINQQDIEAMPARNLADIFIYSPGVDVEPQRGFGRATSISIQGSDSRQIRVMVDGMPFNPQSSGQVNPSQFPTGNISRIEVIKGSSSSLWGSGLGGVVNIISKEPSDSQKMGVRYTQVFSEFHTRRESTEMTGRLGRVGYYLLWDYMISGGEGPRADVLEKKGFGKFVFEDVDLGKLTFLFGYSGADVNSGRYPDGTWQAQPYKTTYGKLSWGEY